MADLTNYGEALVLQWLNTDEAVTRPTAWFIGLFSTAVGEDASGTELTGNGYARQPVDFGTVGDDNEADVTFTASGGNWVAATHCAIFDAVTGGNAIWHGALAASRQIDDGDSIVFSAGDIQAAFD